VQLELQSSGGKAYLTEHGSGFARAGASRRSCRSSPRAWCNCAPNCNETGSDGADRAGAGGARHQPRLPASRAGTRCWSISTCAGAGRSGDDPRPQRRRQIEPAACAGRPAAPPRRQREPAWRAADRPAPAWRWRFRTRACCRG
jgi:hypothetical protein